MSNYLHSRIERLDDFRNHPTITHQKSSFRKQVQGYVKFFFMQAQGSDKYEAQSKYKQTGPIVMGGGRYDTYYYQTRPMGYGTPVIVK